MKTYKELLETTKSRCGIVITLGRFQPPHRGHQILVNKMLELSKKNNYDDMLYISQTNDKVANPLSWNDKIVVLSEMFPDVNISRNKDIRTVFDIIGELRIKGYKNIIMVVGSDRADGFEITMSKYVEDFDSFQIVSAGERKESDMSGTQM